LERGVAMPPKERMHPLFYPMNNVLVYDERVGEALLGTPRLIVVAGTRLSEETLLAVRRRAEQGAAVIIASWLVPERWRTSGRVGEGTWIVADSFLDNDAVQETLEPFIGGGDCWRQRFGSGEVRMFRGDAAGFTLDFEIVGKRGG